MPSSLHRRFIFSILCALSLFSAVFVSCKKEESFLKVDFARPVNGSDFRPNTAIDCSARVTSSGQLLQTFAYILSPLGDTVQILTSNQGSKDAEIWGTFNHQAGFGEGYFFFKVYALSRNKQVVASVRFKVGDVVVEDDSPAIVSVSSGSAGTNYEIWSTSGSKVGSYEISDYASHSTGFGQFMYYRTVTTNRWIRVDGKTGNNPQIMENNTVKSSMKKFRGKSFYLVDYLATAVATRGINKSGNWGASYIFTDQPNAPAYDFGEFMVTATGPDGNQRIRLYNNVSGGLLATFNMPSGETARGFFHFGDENRVFIVAENSLRQTVVRALNKSLSTISSFPIANLTGRPVWGNPILVEDNNSAESYSMIVLDNEIYQFKKGESTQAMFWLNINRSGIGSYEYSKTSGLAIFNYSSRNRWVAYNYLSDKQILSNATTSGYLGMTLLD